MTIIGLTGSIASGKSLVSGILKELGANIVDADKIAREIVEPGQKAWMDIKNVFGADILSEDGTINRKKLAGLVFEFPDKLEILNSITHPHIIAKITEEVNNYRVQKDNLAGALVIDAPLLIETGLNKLVDSVWVVFVPEKIQIERLMARDNISREEAQDRINSQMPANEKLKYADFIIDNSGGVFETKQKVESIWKQLFRSGDENIEI